MLFSFGSELISSIEKGDGGMKAEFIEDMKLEDDETETFVERFAEHLARRDKEWRDLAAPGVGYTKVMRSALWDTFGGMVTLSSILFFIADVCGMCYIAMVLMLTNYLKNPDTFIEEGVLYVAIFALLMFSSAIARNHFYYIGVRCSITMRKTLISALYSKVSKLSLKSLASTNSGKLITLVSANLLQLERHMIYLPLLIFVPLSMLCAYSLLWYMTSWEFAVIAFACSIVLMIIQFSMAIFSKSFTLKEAHYNDQRQKFIQDMVVGARTIKSYGWENHYYNRITELRGNQLKYGFWVTYIGQLGFSFFQNGGLLVAMLIFGIQWGRGDYLEEGQSVVVMALVFYIFLSSGSFVYFALVTLKGFLATVDRLASVFEMEEFEQKRKIDVAKEDAHVKIEGADFTWGFKVKQEGEAAKAAGAAPALEPEMAPVVEGINLDMKPGDFVVVIGQIGSGKTSLLFSVMQETILQKGTVSVAGSIAYVEQEPFIYSSTVKENILFG